MARCVVIGVLFLVVGTHGSKILTRGMIRAPPGNWDSEREFLPVPLKLKDEPVEEKLAPTQETITVVPISGTTTTISSSTTELTSENVAAESSTTIEPEVTTLNFSSDSSEDYSLTVEDVSSEENATQADKRHDTSEHPSSGEIVETAFNREQRGVNGDDLWRMMTRAYDCLWSGQMAQCITVRVMPLFKAMFGYHQFRPYHMTPRSVEEPPYDLDLYKIEEDLSEGKGRKKKHQGHHHQTKMISMLAFGVMILKFFLLPVLSGLALVSGKALFFSFLSLAMAAFSTASRGHHSADKRIELSSAHDHNRQAGYYIMK